MLKVIGGEQEGEFKAVASGTLPNGKPVVVNADGTVSSVSVSSVSDNVDNSNTLYTGSPGQNLLSVYHAAQDVVVVFYWEENNNLSYAVAGTVSGTAITFGTPASMGSLLAFYSAIYDPSTEKIVISGAVSGQQRLTTLTVSGTTCTWSGTFTPYDDQDSTSPAESVLSYDPTYQVAVIAYTNTFNRITVRTVRSSDMTLGTYNLPNGTATSGQYFRFILYHPVIDRHIIYYDNGTTSTLFSQLIQVTAATGSNITSSAQQTLSLGTATIGDQRCTAAYDENSEFVFLHYHGTSLYGTVKGFTYTTSGTSTSTTATIWQSQNMTYPHMVYNAAAQKVFLAAKEDGGSERYLGTAFDSPTASSAITFSTPFVCGSSSGSERNQAQSAGMAYIPTASRNVLAVENFTNAPANKQAKTYLITQAYSQTNLTAENYIGMSRGVVDGQSQVVGTSTVFDTDVTTNISSVYDANSQKVVIAYRDNSTNYGTAIVGTVSGTSITFGSAVVFESGNTSYISAAYDSASQKVVISYTDDSNSSYGTAIVGTVSGTSISFGSPVVFNSTNTTNAISSTFDSNSGKVVISYRDYGNGPYYGTAIVGTVSGNSISFGTSVVFNSANTPTTSIVYDSTSQKVVVAYQNSGNSGYAEAIVGTVSGTSISFGSSVVIASVSVQATVATYDSNAQKVVVAYTDNDNSASGTAVVGTVSGTSISFGTPVVFDDTGTVNATSIAFDSSANAVVIAYRDYGNSQYGTFVTGTVSGTSITFGTTTVFEAATTDSTSVVYDSTEQKTIINYGNANDGISVVVQVGYENRYPVADGNPATLDIIGSVSDNQLSLTAGEKYYVQTDGTLSTTAGSPSVLAGTAISATKLVVKT
jgi:hypothetical protein